MTEITMIWTGVIAIALIAVTIWATKSSGAAQKAVAEGNETLILERVTIARRFYLETLQRELANVILSEDLEAFEKAFYVMREWESETERADQNRRDAEYNLLMQKFPRLEEFDLIGSKHFIRYDDASIWNLEDAIERYKDISKFLILDPDCPQYHRNLSFKGEIELFRERIRKYKDKRLKAAMEDAMSRYFAWRQDRDSQELFNDKDYEVVSLMGNPCRPFTPEIEYGIACKKLNEFGIYSFFAGDEKTYYSFHRSDALFSKDSALVHF